MKKETVGLLAITVISVLMISFLMGTGFNQRTDVALFDYSVSEDGDEITLNVHVMSSMGYTRGFKDSGGGVKPHYLTFYSTFGGLNSSLGAKNTFVLEVAPEDTEIYFNRPDKGYELILSKDAETGRWNRVTEQE